MLGLWRSLEEPHALRNGPVLSQGGGAQNMEFCLILKPFSDAADGTVGRGGKKKKIW